MIKVNYSTCVGCGACYSVCPVKAIKMKQNSRGFYYPVIEKKNCIGCNMCNIVCMCNQGNKVFKSDMKIRYYIAEHKNAVIHHESQSGGISYALGEEILARKGVVYGCVYNDDCVAVHARISTIENLNETRGSKYVQSDLCNTYQNIYEDLKDRIVLFTGTPCQVEGLYRFLEGKKSSTVNLYTADIICHGVPSPLILKEFLKYIEYKNGSKVKELNLRNKKYAPDIVTTITLENENIVKCGFYSELFYTNICLRESCGKCGFATVNRNSDITMGDITGLDSKYHSNIDMANPPSILLIRTSKGMKLINDCNINKLEILPDEFDQPNLHKPSEISPQKEKFWRDYSKNGFEYIIKKYTSAGGKRVKLKRKIMQKIHKW